MIPNNDFNFENHLDNDEIIENNVDEVEKLDITSDSNDSNLDEKVASEDSSLSKNETVETNCLALTVRKDYSLSIFKNSIFTSIRMSIKVAVLTAILNIIKLFF